MSANDRQEGGSHYQAVEYQHWDWVSDIRLPYLLGCATKYVARHRQKHGAEDLRKAIHYLEKAEERGVPPTTLALTSRGMLLTDKFAQQLPPIEGSIVALIALGYNTIAQKAIVKLLDSYPQECGAKELDDRLFSVPPKE